MSATSGGPINGHALLDDLQTREVVIMLFGYTRGATRADLHVEQCAGVEIDHALGLATHHQPDPLGLVALVE